MANGQYPVEIDKILEVYSICDKNNSEIILDSIFSLDKQILRNHKDGIKSKIETRFDECLNSTKDSLKKEFLLDFTIDEYNNLSYSVSKKFELINDYINSYLNRKHLNHRDSSHLITLHWYLGNAYSQFGYHEKALNTYAKGLNFSSTSSDANGLSIRWAKYVESIKYIPSKENIKEYQGILNAIQNISSYDKDLRTYFIADLNLITASHFTHFKQKDSADFYLSLVPEDLNLYSIQDNRRFTLSRYYKQFEEWNAYEKSLLNIAKQVTKQTGSAKREHIHLGTYYLRQKDYLKAKNHFTLSKSQSIEQDKEVIIIQDELAYINALLGLAEIDLLMDVSKNPLKMIHEARQLLMAKLSYSEFQKDKIKLLELYAEIVRLVVTYQNSLSLSEKELLVFIEESKSMALYDEIRQNKLLKKEIGPSKFGKFKALQDSALITKMKLNELGLSTSTRILLEQKKVSFEDSISAIRNHSKINGIQNFDMSNYSDLDANSSIIQYYTTDTLGIILLVKEDTIKVKHIRLNEYKTNAIEAFNLGIRNHRYDLKKLDSLALLVYDIFISPIENELTKNILIIPHGIASSIPFEVLQSKSGSYLVESHNISYAFSLGVNQEMAERGREKTKFIGFAPSYNSKLEEYTFSSLSENLEELDYASKFFSPATKFKNNEANKLNFKRHISDADIVHISAHADIHPNDNDYSYVAFSDQSGIKDSSLLYLSELYNMDLDIEMIVLSACNTSVGTYKDGEGILSLARGFAYAGASSIVSSLWKVNETSTREIISEFYNGLGKGKNKAHALAEAKRSYLKNNSGRDRHPYYWSGLVILGNTSPLNISGTNWYFLLLLIFPLAYLFKLKKA